MQFIIEFVIILQNTTYQENLLLRSNDITLSNIDCLYQIVDGKKRAIGPQSKISSKLEGIQIVCKVCILRTVFIRNCCHQCHLFFISQNFRVFKFGFKRCEIGKGKLIVEALAQISFPNQHDLHFAYIYR